MGGLVMGMIFRWEMEETLKEIEYGTDGLQQSE